MELKTAVPYTIAACILAVAALHVAGIIDIGGFLNPKSQNYLNLHNVLNPAAGDCPFCPATSLEAGNECCTNSSGIRVSAVLTPDCCQKCPEDTYEDGKDVMAAGGPYKVCKCREC